MHADFLIGFHPVPISWTKTCKNLKQRVNENIRWREGERMCEHKFPNCWSTANSVSANNPIEMHALWLSTCYGLMFDTHPIEFSVPNDLLHAQCSSSCYRLVHIEEKRTFTRFVCTKHFAHRSIFIIYCCSTKALWFFSMVRKLLSSIWMDWILNWVFGAEKYDKSIYTKREREWEEEENHKKHSKAAQRSAWRKERKKWSSECKETIAHFACSLFCLLNCCIAATDGAKQQRILAILG